MWKSGVVAVVAAAGVLAGLVGGPALAGNPQQGVEGESFIACTRPDGCDTLFVTLWKTRPDPRDRINVERAIKDTLGAAALKLAKHGWIVVEPDGKIRSVQLICDNLALLASAVRREDGTYDVFDDTDISRPKPEVWGLRCPKTQ